MAELSAIRTIIGLAGAVAKLTIVLHDLASTICSADPDVRVTATDLPLLLRLEGSTLERARSSRYSLSEVSRTRPMTKKLTQGLPRMTMDSSKRWDRRKTTAKSRAKARAGGGDDESSTVRQKNITFEKVFSHALKSTGPLPCRQQA